MLMGQPTFKTARTRLTRGLSEPSSIQPTFENNDFFSTQSDLNLWWAKLAHWLELILTSLNLTKWFYNMLMMSDHL